MIDIGLNLTNRAFAGDRDAVLQRARDAGVIRMVVTGTDLDESREAQLLAQKEADLFSTAGVHPHEAKTCDGATLATLRELAGLPGVVAIGECGLDFNRNYSPQDVQVEWFEKQVVLACELNKPLFLHEREAGRALREVLDRHGEILPRVVVHCFTGTADDLHAYLERDFYIGITGWICDERRGLQLRELVGLIPTDRLMLESDAPFLLPRSLRPKPKSRRNEPAYLGEVRDAIAEICGRSPAQVAEASSKTARRFFGWDEDSSD